MTYEEARIFMQGTLSGVHLGLDRLERLMEELGHPESEGEYIHIAGTNGKGSIAAYITGALMEAGYRVGTYTSPVVYEYGEQYRINDVMITHEDYTRLAGVICDAVGRMREAGQEAPSSFEMETALALLWFREQACDWVVLECGMGGRTDATNVITGKRLAVFASISMDHMQYLGGSLAEIARVKAGIIKPGCTAVTSEQAPEVMEVLREECALYSVPLRVGRQADAEWIPEKKTINRENDGIPAEGTPAEGTTGKGTPDDGAELTGTKDILPGTRIRYHGHILSSPLTGICQMENMVTAYEALCVLREQGAGLTDEMICRGMQRADWTGRFSAICRSPLFIVDGAHNARAALILRDSIETYFPGRRKIFIMGVFADKDYREVIRLTAPLADRILAIETPDNERALPAEQLAEEIRAVNPHVSACASVAEAVDRAFEMAGKEDVIISFGSLSNIGLITSLVKERSTWL